MKNQKTFRRPEEIEKERRQKKRELEELDKEWKNAVKASQEETDSVKDQNLGGACAVVEENVPDEGNVSKENENPKEDFVPAKETKFKLGKLKKSKKDKKKKESKDSGILLPILVAFAVVIIAGGLIFSLVPHFRGEEPDQPPVDTNAPADTQQPSDTDAPVDTQKPEDTDAPVDTPKPDDTDAPAEPVKPEFVMADFKASVVNITSQLTDEADIAANVDIFVENIGEDKLKELIEKSGELNVQKAIAEMLAFVPEIKMQQYITNNGLDYNPNADSDYSEKLEQLKGIYVDATGKNPDGVLMSLEGYEMNKSNRAAMEAMIIETGDTALLEWYKAKTATFDLRMKQMRDTETAEKYKEEVKLELVNSTGTVKLFELQLEQEVAGTLSVMDNVSMRYTEDYNQFVLNNYMYVIANQPNN